MNEETVKEIAFVCCLIQSEDMFNETYLQAFDKVYEIANAFVAEHGVVVVDEHFEVDFEEMVMCFAYDYAKEKMWKLKL